MTVPATGQEYLVVLCTCPDQECAHSLARQLVEQGLAACVNTLPGVKSTYLWEGKVESADEHLLLIKTSRAHYPRLEARIRHLHPYRTPEVVALPITAGSAEYLSWLGASLAPRPE